MIRGMRSGQYAEEVEYYLSGESEICNVLVTAVGGFIHQGHCIRDKAANARFTAASELYRYGS
jgi:hypothetical protein